MLFSLSLARARAFPSFKDGSEPRLGSLPSSLGPLGSLRELLSLSLSLWRHVIFSCVILSGVIFSCVIFSCVIFSGVILSGAIFSGRTLDPTRHRGPESSTTSTFRAAIYISIPRQYSGIFSEVVASGCVLFRCVLFCVMFRSVMLRCVMLRCVMFRNVMLRCVMFRSVMFRCVMFRCVMLRCVCSGA